MKSLSELRLVLGGLQDQVNECVDYLDQLAGVMGWGGTGTKRRYIKRANGIAPRLPYKLRENLPDKLREQVKAHYQRERGTSSQRGDMVPSPPNSPYITIEEAAAMLHVTDNGVRHRIKNGVLPSSTEMRQTRTKGVGARPHKIIVVDRAAVEAVARGDAPPTIHGTARIAPTPPPPARRGSKLSAIAQQRQRTIDYLAKF